MSTQTHTSVVKALANLLVEKVGPNKGHVSISVPTGLVMQQEAKESIKSVCGDWPEFDKGASGRSVADGSFRNHYRIFSRSYDANKAAVDKILRSPASWALSGWSPVEKKAAKAKAKTVRQTSVKPEIVVIKGV